MTIGVQIVSLPDRKYVVAELWRGDKQIAEVSNEEGDFRVEFYILDGQKELNLSLEDLLSALNLAKRKLSYNGN